MREIKFRVFDKGHGSTHAVGSDSHDSFHCFDTIVTYYNLQNGEGSGEHGDYILMQYVGLQDIENRDVYEGDVVKTEHGLGVVSFDDGTFYIDGTHVVDFIDLWDSFKNLHMMKILGNIHEHPHLVEGESNETN